MARDLAHGPPPGPAAPPAPASIPQAQAADHQLLTIRGGSFLMGSDAAEGFADDGEGPAREVTIADFRIAATTVTNRQFAHFVRATGYITDAERSGASFVFHLQAPPAIRDEPRARVRGLPWWLSVEHACWQRPEGPGSQIHTRPDHPVVHVSWHDARAYCDWAGLSLPTEAQWEYAARGGLSGRRFAWGDELAPEGVPRCNIFRGDFPDQPAQGWSPGPVRADAFEANGLGLHNVSGNVWQWCEDWFSPRYHRDTAPDDPCWRQPTDRRSMRGGSFLCHDSYCNRYRVAARSGNTPDSHSGNVGFRVVSNTV